MPIYVSQGGSEFIVVTLMEQDGRDISTDPVEIALGTPEQPGDWFPAAVVALDESTLEARYLIQSVDPGTYTLWIKLTDSPEEIVRRFDEPVVVA